MCVWVGRGQGYYRLDIRCKPCPDLAWLLVTGFCLVITALLLVGVWLNQRRINLAALGIGVDFLQVGPCGRECGVMDVGAAHRRAVLTALI